MKVRVVRCECTEDGDTLFQRTLKNALDNPPPGCFYQDMKFSLGTQHEKLWQQAVVIYGDIPTL